MGHSIVHSEWSLITCCLLLQLHHTNVTDLPASADGKAFDSGGIELAAGIGSHNGAVALLRLFHSCLGHIAPFLWFDAHFWVLIHSSPRSARLACRPGKWQWHRHRRPRSRGGRGRQQRPPLEREWRRCQQPRQQLPGHRPGRPQRSHCEKSADTLRLRDALGCQHLSAVRPSRKACHLPEATVPSQRCELGVESIRWCLMLVPSRAVLCDR